MHLCIVVGPCWPLGPDVPKAAEDGEQHRSQGLVLDLFGPVGHQPRTLAFQSANLVCDVAPNGPSGIEVVSEWWRAHKRAICGSLERSQASAPVSL